MRNKKILALLVLVVCIVYANSLSSGFVWDDKPLIVQKQLLFSHPSNAARILILSDAPLELKTPYYRPLNTLTYMLDHYLWGLHPFWYHLENVLLHVLVVIVFYLLLMEVFGDGKLAFIAAALFAVYPVNAEAVDFISARNTLLCALFSMASFLFLAKGKKVLPLLAYFLALLSEEPAVVLPFFLLSMELTGGLPSGEKGPKIKKAVLAGFFGVTAVYFIIRHLVLGTFIARHGIMFSQRRLKLITAVYFEHFRLMLYPFILNADYTMKQISFSYFKSIAAACGVFLLLYLSLRKKTPAPVRAGAQWIFWGLLPVSNIVKIPSAPVAERFQYMIVFGFVLIAGYFLSGLQKRKALAGYAVFFVLVLALGFRTFERNFIWKDDVSLYSSMIRSDPENSMAHYDLGNVYERHAELENAVREFRTALAIDPYNINSLVDIGVAFAEEGRLDDAIGEFKTALDLDPGNIMAMSDIGMAYEKEGLFKEAAAEFQNVLRLAPGDTMAIGCLDKIKNRTGKQ